MQAASSTGSVDVINGWKALEIGWQARSRSEKKDGARAIGKKGRNDRWARGQTERRTKRRGGGRLKKMAPLASFSSREEKRYKESDACKCLSFCRQWNYYFLGKDDLAEYTWKGVEYW